MVCHYLAVRGLETKMTVGLEGLHAKLLCQFQGTVVIGSCCVRFSGFYMGNNFAHQSQENGCHPSFVTFTAKGQATPHGITA